MSFLVGSLVDQMCQFRYFEECWLDDLRLFQIKGRGLEFDAGAFSSPLKVEVDLDCRFRGCAVMNLMNSVSIYA